MNISGQQDRTVQFRRLSDLDLAELDQAAQVPHLWNLTDPIEFVPSDLDDIADESDIVKAFELGRQCGQTNSENRYWRGMADGIELVYDGETSPAAPAPVWRRWSRSHVPAHRRPAGGGR